MKQNTKLSTTKNSEKAEKIVKIAPKTNQKSAKTAVSAHRTTPSGLDRDIVVQSALATSLLVNLFFLATFLVITANSDYAHVVGRAIFNL